MGEARMLLALVLLLVLSVTAYGVDSDSGSVSPAGKPNLRSPALVLVKIWCLIIVFVATFAGGMSPYFMKWNEGFLVLGTQFAGGVFLGTSLMHFLDDSNATFDDLTSVDYPFAFMLACAGYLMTMFADCTVSRVYNKHGTGSQNGPSSVEAAAAPHPENKSPPSFKDDPTEESHHGAASLSTATSVGDSILLIAALCFHSIFEGIAIGVAETKEAAWRTLWTVCLHKIFAAVAMGIALLRMIPNRPLLSCAVYAFLFAISSPLGVAIGIIIDATAQGRVADWIYAISMGLASGVFVYVCINHLITKGYKPQKSVPVPVDTQSYRFLAVLCGVAVIAIVMIWDT